MNHNSQDGCNHVQDLTICCLSDKEYDEICDFSMRGFLASIIETMDRIVTERHCKVGPNTFFRDPIQQKPAPLVLSAQYGHKTVVDYFIKRYGSVIDINHPATIISLTTHKKVHCATPLWAASTGGHLEIVQALITHGAEVNKATLTQSTPLRGASFHGHLDVMDHLLQNGAMIDTPNCIGQSPLCIAAMRGKLDAVMFLIEKGANKDQATINGYTIMHLSATKGRVDVVNYLLSIGLSPMFGEARPSSTGYIACPLFLAASTGQRKMVEIMVEHQDCPPSCRADALLLLGSTRCEISSRGLTFGSQDLWEQGLRIRSQHNIKVDFLPPNENYGNRHEMRDIHDLNELTSIPNFARFDAYYQSLMIRERCMGFGDQGLIYFLIRRGAIFCSRQHKYREAELLWFRAMEQEVEVCEMEISHDRYGHSEGLQKDLEKDLSQYAAGIHLMVHNEYGPDFKRYVEFGFKELEILEYLKKKSENALFIDLQTLLGILLYIFMSWIHYDTEVCNRREVAEGNLCSFECDHLGRQLVDKYLMAIPGSSLLHYALTNFFVGEDQEINDSIYIYDKYPDISKIIEALVHWGAYKVIDWPNDGGLRPIHVAIETSNVTVDGDVQELASLLVSNGAHLDAVCRMGTSVYERCTSDTVRTMLRSAGPLSLACLAAQCIVKEGLPYANIGLPSYITKMVKLHDKDSCVQQLILDS